jgi:hypothetical protein
MIVLLLIGFAFVAIWELPALVRNRWWREIILFMVLWSAGFMLSVMISLGITLPPISTIINKAVTGMFGW